MRLSSNLSEFMYKQAEKPSYLQTLLRGMGRGAVVGGLGGAGLGGYMGSLVGGGRELLHGVDPDAKEEDDPSFLGSVATGAGIGLPVGAVLGAGAGGLGNVLKRFIMANELATMSEAAQSGNVDKDIIALLQAAQAK